MSEVYTCLLCGRRGTQRFVMVAADPDNPEAGHRARCQDRRPCQRRITVSQATSGGEGAAGEAGSAGDASVAGLARQVDELAGHVRNLRGLHAQVEDITRVLGELAEQVQALAARPVKDAAPSWLVLPAEQVSEIFADLTEWLAVVWLRYPDNVKALPECWAWHPDVVEELCWLRHAWHAAYHGPSASTNAAADWHDRYRPNVAKRIKAAAGMCSLDNHTDPAPPAAVPLAELLDPVTAWWAESRHEPAPVPSGDQFEAATKAYQSGR